MNEITLPKSEAIIDAGATGATVPGHEELGQVFAALHAPGEETVAAPDVAVRTGAVRRVARRTAVAATAAVLGVAGMAAAESGVLDSVLPGPDPVVEIADGAQQEGGEPEAVATADDDDHDAPAEGAPASAEPKGHEVEIEGVDTSDGVDDEELAIACDGVGNHGEYVRLVARDKLTEHDGTHGDRVSEAASSDCGKPESGDTDDGDENEAETDDDEADEADDEADEADEADEVAPGNGKAKGHSNGNGNGNGNGHGRGNGNGHAHDVTDE
ncbi:MAG: hypothetical protein R8F63_01265 [Acidimicrobiales bacterium]|nr:hypothetical protein [Acidimicrobiales bacterium]